MNEDAERDRRFVDAQSSGGGGGDGTPWHRHRGLLLGAAVAVILVITVITDLPAPASRGSEITADTAVVKQVNGDIAGCAYSVQEAYTIYAAALHGRLSAADRSSAPKLLTEDRTACSLVNADIFDLTNIDIPGTASGKRLAEAVGTVTTWATGDAVGSIAAIQALYSDLSDRRALAALDHYSALLASDRAAAMASFGTAEADVRARLIGLGLPALPAPGGSPLTP